MTNFEKQVIAITGATGGIGSATAQRVIDLGGRVVVCDLSSDKVNELVERLGPNARGLAVDVTSLADNQAMVELAESEFGCLNGAFLNAGIEGRVAPFEQQTDADWEQVFNVNFHGVRWGTQAVIPAIRRAGGGSIVITSSVAGVRGAAGLTPYVSSKHALLGLMRSLCAEYGREGIRINTLNPGPVDNRMMRSIEEQTKPGEGEQVKQAFTARVPLGRYVSNAECAAMACFLLSHEASGISGNTYMVDGGYCAG